MKRIRLWAGLAVYAGFALFTLTCTPEFNNPLDPENPNRMLSPEAPASLAALAVTESTVTLSWPPVSGTEAALSVEKFVGKGFQEIAVLSMADTSFRDTGLASKTTYTYRIALRNLVGTGYSPDCSVKTLNVPPAFAFTRPVVQNDASLLIEWYDRDPDDDATIQFYYDLTRNFKGTRIQTPAEITEDDPNQYLWNYDGSIGGGKPCNIYARISDSDTAFYVYAPGSFLLPVKPVYISFIEPADGETVGVGSVTLNGTVNATHGIDILRINKDNVPIVNANMWSKTVTLTPGQNLFQILVIDDSSFVFTDTLTVYYVPGAADSSPPALVVAQPRAGDTVSSPQVQVSGTAHDVSGVLSVLVNGNPVQVANPWSYSLPLASEGANLITVSAKDNSPAQNEAVETLTVYFNPVVQDLTPPLLIITNPGDNDTLIGASVVVDGVAQDNGGISSVQVGNNPDALLPDSRGVWSTTVSLDSGWNTIQVKATDNSGNTRAESVTVWQNSSLQDFEPPEIRITSPGNHVEFSNLSGIEILGTAHDNAGIFTVEVNGVGAALSNGVWQATVDFPGTDSGAYTFVALATDINGLQAADTVVLVYNPLAQDQTPPVVTLISPANGKTVSTTPVPVWVRVKDDQSGVDSVTIKGQPGTGVGADTFQAPVDLVKGPNDIVVRAVDKKGNAVSPVYRIILDDKPPAIALKSHTEGQQVPATAVTFQVTVKDSTSGIFSVLINDSAAVVAGPDIYERTLTLSPGGPTAIRVTATDNSSFKNAATDTFHLTYNASAQDLTAPVVSFLSPFSGAVVASTPQTVKIRASDDVGVVSVNIGSVPAALVTGTADQYEASIQLAVGQNDVAVVAADAVPNRRFDTLRITYNPPLSAVSLSVGSPVTASSIPLSWTPSAVPDFASYRLYSAASPGVAAVPANIVRADTNINAAAYTVTGLTERKTYYFRIFVYDDFGDTAGSAEVSATTANAPPPAITLIAGTSVTSTSLTVGWTAASTALDFSHYKVCYDTVSGVSLASRSLADLTNKAATSAQITGLMPNTTYYVRVYVFDTYGASTPSTNQVSGTTDPLPDVTAPAVSINYPVPGNTYTTGSNSVTLSGTATDNVGVALVTWTSSRGDSGTASGTANWSASGIPLNSGPNVLIVTARDAAGNRGRDTLTVTRDAAVPVDTVPPAPVTLNAPVSISFSSMTLSWSLSGAPDFKSYQLFYSTAAGVTITSMGGPSVTDRTTLTANLTGLSASTPYFIRVFVFDSAGNAAGSNEVSGTTTAPPDVTNPAASIFAPANGFSTASGTITVEVTATDNLGVTAVNVYCNSAPVSAAYASGTGRWTAAVNLTSGNNSIYAHAYDAAGNSGVSSTVNGTYTPPDVTNPTASIASPGSGTSTNQSSVPVQVSASDNVGVASVEINCNGNWSAAPLNGSTGYYQATAVLQPGANTIYARAWDAAGNWGGSSAISVTYTPPDTVNPSISITSPAVNPYPTLTGSVDVSGTASDNKGVTQVTWANDRGGSGTASGTTNWSVTGIALQGGSNLITVTARDSAGLTNSASLTVAYTPPDVTDPSATIIYPPDGHQTASTSQLVQVDASDNIGVTSVSVNGVNASYNGGFLLWEATVPLSAGAGGNSITATAYDAAGNSGGSNTVNVTYTPPDTTPPTVTITSHSNDQWVNITPITVTADATDAGSGVKEVSINGTTTAGFSGSGSYSLSIGDNTVEAWAVDNANNAGVHRINVRLDTVPPSGSCSADGTWEFVGNIVNACVNDASDGESGIASVSVDNSGSNCANVYVAFYGANYYNVDIIDNAGNQYNFSFVINGQ